MHFNTLINRMLNFVFQFQVGKGIVYRFILANFAVARKTNQYLARSEGLEPPTL